ncbi:MAG: thioredoxin [Bdellovibrio sp.]|nr:thioredoxin [Bdellovibrio sp.]
MGHIKNVLEVSDADFEDMVLKSNQLIIVDFWAEWCNPCKALAPTLDAIATEYTEKIKICKVNIDQNPNTPSKYHVRGIPTVIFFNKGQAIELFIGNQPKETYLNAIEKHLKTS